MPSQVEDDQEAIERAIAPLTEEQLQRRPIPGLRTPGEIAAHIVFGRALHLHRTLGEEAADLAPLLQWGDARLSTTDCRRNSPWTGTDVAMHHRLSDARMIYDAIPEKKKPSCKLFGVPTTICPTLGNCRCCWVPMGCLGLIPACAITRPRPWLGAS